jgi:hypothetical protein
VAKTTPRPTGGGFSHPLGTKGVAEPPLSAMRGKNIKYHLCDDSLDKSMINFFLSFKKNNPELSGLSQWHDNTAVSYESMR